MTYTNKKRKRMNSFIRKVLYRLKIIKYKHNERVFCLSMQRTGTTSVGQFFKDFGLSWAGWNHDKLNDWSKACYDGDFEKVFSSPDFTKSNAFEDSPWFFPEFYKVLYHRFPNSKFILFIRDSDKWFDSMVSHSNNNILGRARGHTKIYRRELEYFNLLGSNRFNDELENTLGTDKIMKLSEMRDHYINIYNRHNIEVQDFFERHSPASLIVCKLEAPEKWQKLGDFLNVSVPTDYGTHQNRSDSTTK
jgi:hypothetical protein